MFLIVFSVVFKDSNPVKSILSFSIIELNFILVFSKFSNMYFDISASLISFNNDSAKFTLFNADIKLLISLFNSFEELIESSPIKFLPFIESNILSISFIPLANSATFPMSNPSKIEKLF